MPTSLPFPELIISARSVVEREVNSVTDNPLILTDAGDPLFLLGEGRDTWSVFTAEGPGRVAPLGAVPRPVNSLSVSRDRRRVVANVRDYRADAWMSRVIR